MPKYLKRISLALFLFFLITQNSLFAQNISAEAKADTNRALIGDHIGIKLQISVPKKTDVVFPALADSIGKIEIVSMSKIDTLEQNGEMTLSRKITVTCFDTGFAELPPFVFMYEQKQTRNLYPVETAPLFLYFATVDVDTALPIKDIKGPIEEPLTFAELLPYILTGLAVAAAIFGLVFYFLKKKPKAKFDLHYDPTVPPHIAAMKALKELESDKLWQKGLVKEYYIRLTEILRIYLERKFRILALEMTSDEIMDSITDKNIDYEISEQLRKILTTADLAKFAKYESAPEECLLCMQYALSFVGKTAETAQETQKPLQVDNSENNSTDNSAKSSDESKTGNEHTKENGENDKETEK